MNTLLVLIFIIKILARSKLFNTIREKHGLDTLRAVRNYERQLKRQAKLKCDLSFLLTCKKEQLTPNFARPRFSIKMNKNASRRIGKIILETEIGNKHKAKNKIKEKTMAINNRLKTMLSYLEHKAIQYRLRRNLDKWMRKWKATQARKLENLRKENAEKQGAENTSTKPLPNIVHNFSSYILSEEERKALAHGLDHYIPDRIDKRKLEVEFEHLYKNILWNAENLGEEEKLNLKTKILSCYKNYGTIKTPYQYKETINKLSKNENICLLKQDKGRGIVIVDRNKYVEKCLGILQTDKFTELTEDPTAKFEKRVQNCLRKMKKRLGLPTYNSIYPTASRPGRFYGTAKLHKLNRGCKDVNQLPIRPIISNIGTATYKTSKYLAKLLAPLTKSEYSITSTAEFISRIRDLKVDKDHDMVSFDVSNLFTNVPLDFTIDLVLKKVYNKKMVKTKLKKEELRELLKMCTKELHFTYNGKTYQQSDGVCMGSPLGPVLANVFMVHLEETITPKLKMIMPTWIRYVDDTFTLVKKGKLEEIITTLNNFHENINFTHEFEKEGKIPFLDVLVKKEENGRIQTGVYRKETNNSIYINWNAYAPKQWKIGTLRGMVRRAYDICSNEDELTTELTHLREVFTRINGYPSHLVDTIMKNVKDERNTTRTEENSAEEENETTTLMVKMPFAGEKGEGIIKDLNRTLQRNLPNNIQCRIVRTGTKLQQNFNIKDKLEEKHRSNFVYQHECQNKRCTEDYIGETGRRKELRTGEHGGTDKESWIYKHSIKTKHPKAKDKNFKILGANYDNRRKRRIAEALYIRDLKPTLNKQKESYKLTLFA